MEGDLTWVVNTQYNVQMMYCGIVHLEPINFINQCHPNKFNNKVKEIKSEQQKEITHCSLKNIVPDFTM